MHSKRAWCVAFIAAALPLAALADSPELPDERPSIRALERSGFYDAVAVIEASHPMMYAARAGLQGLEAKLKQAQWAYFPSFELTVGIAPTPEITGDALKSTTHWDKWGYAAGARLTMVQPVYTFGKIRSLQRAGEQGIEIGDAGIDLVRLELRYRLAQAWFGVLLARENRKMIDDGREWLYKAADRMESLRDEDSDDYDQSEYLRLRSREAEFYALEAENRLLETRAVHGLRLLTGETDPTKGVPLDEELEALEVTLTTPAQLVALAMENDPLMRINRANEQVKSYMHDHKRAQLLPDLVVLAEANAATSDVIEDQDSSFAHNAAHRLDARAIVALRWQLDVPQRIFQEREAKAFANMAAGETETSLQLAELNVRGLWQEMENVRVLIDAYKKSKTAAQGWLTTNWDLYQDGFADFNEVMDSLEQTVGKRAAYLKSVHDHNILVYALSRAVGQDISKWQRQPDPPDARPPSGGSPSPEEVPR